MIQHDPAKNARETLKILLMEARESDVRYVREILSEDNEAVRQGPSYALEVVDRLDKALRRLPQGGYDVILTDLALPDSTGIPTFRKLYDAAPDVAIVILGGDDPRLAADAVKLGAQDYLFRSKLNANNLPRILQYAAERKKIQRQVHQAEQRYRSVFENSAVAILLADSRGAVESWNQYTEKLFGMKSEDLHLKPLASLYGTKEWEKLCLLRSQRTVGAQERFETRMVRKNGRLMDVDVSVSPLKTPAGKEAGSLTIIRDITEKKRLERLKDEFVSSVSHELRTPLAITREAVAQMAEGILGKTTAKQKQFLRISLENLDRLARIVNDLLDISRLEAGAVKLEKERLDLTTVLRRIVESFEARARKKNITTVFSATAGLEVFADRDKVVQAVTNLIANALKFTEKGKITVSLTDHADRIECCVRDTGCGIAEEDLLTAFDKFRQFRRAAGPGDHGTGLGLAITKEIVELHKGHIWIESLPGEGTAITFSLPKWTAEEIGLSRLSEKIEQAKSEGARFSSVLLSLNVNVRDRKKPDPKILAKFFRLLDDWTGRHFKNHYEVVFKSDGAILLLLPGMTRENTLMASGRMRQVIEDALAKWGIGAAMKPDFSVAAYPEDGATAQELVRKLGLLPGSPS